MLYYYIITIYSNWVWKQQPATFQPPNLWGLLQVVDEVLSEAQRSAAQKYHDDVFKRSIVDTACFYNLMK